MRLLIRVALAFAGLMAANASQGQQIAAPAQLSAPQSAQSISDVRVGYVSSAESSATTNGLGLRVHFESAWVENVEVEVLFESGSLGAAGAQPDVLNFDGDPATDRFVLVSWMDVQGQWPGNQVDIVDLDLALAPGRTGNSRLNFSAVTGDRSSFVSASIELVTADDTDGDGNPDATDPDDDNDGVPDTEDLFPLDASEWADFDGDALGDNADPDDDNDGVNDVDDVFPQDPSRSALASSRLANISTRALVRGGDEVMIGGVIIGGTEPKTIVVTGRGPSLAAFGVPNTLDDPWLQLVDHLGVEVDSNDNWEEHPNQANVPAGIRPTASQDAAIALTVDPGAYTAIVRGVGDAQGVGIVEIFEVDASGDARLLNISTRSFISSGDEVMIGGVIITGDQPLTVTFRARGPSLGAFGVPNTIDDPWMQLIDSSGSLIDQNDNWADHETVSELPAHLTPSEASEAVITRSLEPGAYTAIVRGVGDTTGVGIVEVFAVD